MRRPRYRSRESIPNHRLTPDEPVAARMDRAAELAAEVIANHRVRLLRKAAPQRHVEHLAYNAIRVGVRPKRVTGWIISAPPGEVLEFIANQMAKSQRLMVTASRR